jgi:hypothetical protein
MTKVQFNIQNTRNTTTPPPPTTTTTKINRSSLRPQEDRKISQSKRQKSTTKRTNTRLTIYVNETRDNKYYKITHLLYLVKGLIFIEYFCNIMLGIKNLIYIVET